MKNNMEIADKPVRVGVSRDMFSKKDRICRRIIEYAILGLIIFSPLPAASVPGWSILAIQLTILIMLLTYYFQSRVPITSSRLTKSTRWTRLVFIGLFIFIFFQLLPLPKPFTKLIAPSVYAVKEQFISDFGSTDLLSLSLIPAHTLREGLELLSYFILGFLIIKTVTRKRQIMKIVVALVAMGTFQAFYGLFELTSRNPRILFYKKIYNLDEVTGTFVNGNHLSGYLEMVIPLAIGLIFARTDLLSLSNLSWREKLVFLSEKKILPNVLTSLAIILMSLGIIFSKSRSGIFLLFLNFVLFFGFSALNYKASTPQNKWIKRFIVVIFFVILISSVPMGIGSALENFSGDHLMREDRAVYWANTISIFADFPVFGVGLGVYPSVYPDWESAGITKRLYHAHNDYLEYLTELGIVGVSLLVGGIFFMCINSYRALRKNRHLDIRGVSLACFIGTICILIHSITDFNLHIPANMLLFTVVISLMIVSSYYKRTN